MFKKIRRSLSSIRKAMNYDGDLKHKIRFYQFARIARLNGVNPFRIERVASDYVEGWYGVKDMSDKEKLWYISHGFNPNRKAWYNVTPDNYRSFVSDFEFYRLKSYVNLPFNEWYDNKLTTYYVLRPFVDNQPVHYCYIKNGHLLPVNGCPGKEITFSDMIAWLEDKSLALKKCVGGHGDGFMKLQSGNGNYYLNDKIISPVDLERKLGSLDGYIVTEFVKPGASIRSVIGEDNFAVMRAMTVFDVQDGPQVVGMMIRLGTQKAGHTQAGGDHFYMNVDPDTGKVSDAVYFYDDYSYERTHIHPETNKDLEDIVIPDIEGIRKLVLDISSFLSATPYLVMDIVPTDNGPKLLEINSHGQPFIIDQFVRVKENKYFCKLFKESLDF